MLNGLWSLEMSGAGTEAVSDAAFHLCMAETSRNQEASVILENKYISGNK